LTPHERTPHFRFKEGSSFVGRKLKGCKFVSADGGIKITLGSMMILKGERTVNLYKTTGSIIIGDASAAMEKKDTTRLWHMCLGHMSE